jgi:hypothetical protein
MEHTIRPPVGTAEHLIELAKEGEFAKLELADFLATDKRQAYLDACAAIEKRYTVDCSAAGDPCLADGCALEGETCLQPLLRAEAEYLKACGGEFAKLFADPGNRARPWGL